MKLHRKILLLIVFPLCVGASIYWIDSRVAVPLLIRNYLPDTLWAFAFTSSLSLTGITRGRRIETIILTMFIAFLLEVLQRYISGTYDPLDLLAYATGIGCSTLISIPRNLKLKLYEK